MTVYPFIFHLGPLEITGYGLMLMVAFLMGGWLIARQLRENGLREDYAADIVAAAVIGGFIGGAVAVILNGVRLKVPLRWTMQVTAPALGAAYALGRVGCFLVNDDY